MVKKIKNSGAAENIRVCIRCRDLSDREKEQGCKWCDLYIYIYIYFLGPESVGLVQRGFEKNN